MNSNNTNQKTTFWKFLTDNTIEIPIIQRDYAQGRLGKEYLRKSFLADIKDALDKAINKDNKPKMKLDFVYGSVENGKLSPLDGQQRLTTLWLLHWYIALMSGKLNDEVVYKTLAKFTYETRISSREFCQNLCKPENFTDYGKYESIKGDRKIVEYITSRTWFYSAWKQDPTIQSMLRMLGGTEINDKKGEDIVDGLEELFKCPERCEIKANEKCKLQRDFQSYWNLLISENAPIVFYQLPLKDFGLSDDLYIKMNARGKQLTSFENFKADLVGYIRDNNWTDLLDAKKGIPIKMDTTWTDIFWKSRSTDNRIDEIYFAFLNRFFWNQLFITKDGQGKYFLDIGKDEDSSTQENNNSSYKYLNNSDGTTNDFDTTISYEGLDVYRFMNGEIPKSLFSDWQIVLNRYSLYLSKISGLKNELCCSWNGDFRFIPEYERDKDGKQIEITDKSNNKILKVTHLTQVQRIVFFAICKYFVDEKNYKDEIDDENTTSLQRWMRVVWNLVSGEDADGRPQIRNSRAVRTAIEFIDKLDSHAVYESLRKKVPYINNPSDFENRCNEEIAKTKQILDENECLRRYEGKISKKDGSPYQTWEEILIDAEKYTFFKGAIRFLFQDENGNVNWCNFDKKWENAQKYFDENGVKDCEDKKYRTEAILLKAVLYHVKDFWKYIEPQKFVLDNAASTWKKNILLEQGWEKAVHEILMGNLTVTERNEDCLMYRDLYMTDLLNYVANEQIGSRIRWHHGHRTVYPPRYDGIMLDDKNRDKPFYRNRILASLPNITSSQRIKDKPFYKGWDINFIYSKDGNSYVFQWNTDENVYLTENNERKEKADGTDYCVSVESIKDSEDFIQKLDNLINQARQNEQ